MSTGRQRTNRLPAWALSGLTLLLTSGLLVSSSRAQDSPPLDIWPGVPPGDEQLQLPEEGDRTSDDDQQIAGRRVIRLGNVSRPQLTVYPADPASRNGTAVIVAPGGGFHILAWDLEGTEVAEWFNSIGVTAVVLKYRVPFRNPDRRWEAAVQDAQRAISLVRHHAEEWGIDPDRIGIMGFSAGGKTAGMTALLKDRSYKPVDDIDEVSCQPNFVGLVYPGAFLNDDGTALREYLAVPADMPPVFLTHAHDDPVSSLNSALLYVALKQAGVAAELHVYSLGGHGYGLRESEHPVTGWPSRMADWMKVHGWLE